MPGPNLRGAIATVVVILLCTGVVGAVWLASSGTMSRRLAADNVATEQERPRGPSTGSAAPGAPPGDPTAAILAGMLVVGQVSAAARAVRNPRDPFAPSDAKARSGVS